MSVNLEEIKALCAAATPGPWGKAVFDYRHSTWDICLNGDEDQGTVAYEVGDHDANFIARAREIVPALVEEIEFLRHTVKDQWDIKTAADQEMGELVAGLDAKIDQLTAALRELLKVEWEYLDGGDDVDDLWFSCPWCNGYQPVGDNPRQKYLHDFELNGRGHTSDCPRQKAQALLK